MQFYTRRSADMHVEAVVFDKLSVKFQTMVNTFNKKNWTDLSPHMGRYFFNNITVVSLVLEHKAKV